MGSIDLKIEAGGDSSHVDCDLSSFDDGHERVDLGLRERDRTESGGDVVGRVEGHFP